ncbi:MAG: methyltransferase domain-containing protein [Gemmatimonadales bacterium]|nr:methyltransferase domain-containing protein [Gemmatimonadales bacterium]
MGRARVSRSGIPLNASPQTHAKVLSWFGQWRRGRVFDCPAGAGALAQELAAMGFVVVAGDLDRRPGREVGARRLCADLSRTLPFADASFDYVACVEGIEHLERPVDALREMRRVLRPGGRLVLTTPNVLHLASRVRMLLTGFWSSAPRPFDPAEAITGLEHIMLLTYPILAYFLSRTGFAIERLETNRVVKGSLPWAWLAPIVTLATRLAVRRPAEQEHGRVLTDRRFLFGHTLCFRCRAV